MTERKMSNFDMSEGTCPKHDWKEETLREPNFHVAFGCLRICRLCGKKQYSNFAEGRWGGPFRDVPEDASKATAGIIFPPARMNF